MRLGLPAILRGDRAVDVLGGLVLCAIAEFELVSTVDPAMHRDVAAVMIALQTVPLALRRAFPVAVLAVMLAADLAASSLSNATQPGVPAFSYLALLVATYNVATSRPRRISVPATLVTLIAVFAGAYAANGGTEVPWLLFSLVAPFTVAWLIGDHLRGRRLITEELTARAARLEREREDKAREAVAAERARIARELHDVVAHSLSVVVVQASAAGRVLEHDPAQARTSLAAIETTARDALAEMRRLLGVLRHDAHERPLAPQPGLGQLDGLLGTMRGAGLPVDLIVEGELRDLPQGLDLSAYRVVQEALTNVLKHAGATRATVAIGYREQALEIEVRDDGAGGSAARDGLGQGLIGMRERVAVFGGTLDCGPRRGGGFAVRARFPVPSAG